MYVLLCLVSISNNIHFRFILEQLKKWGVDVDTLKQVVTTRIFRAWIEDWEPEAIRKQDAVMEAKLLEKYKGLVFLDHENGGMVQTICSENLEWRRKNKSMGVDYSGYYLISIGADDEEEYSWEINQNICDYIASAKQTEGVKILRKGEDEIVVD
jgi:hypothetical protein